VVVMIILYIRLELRFLYSRFWRTGDPLQMCAYIPVQESSIPELVTSDDGTCGNGTIVHVFEHILYNRRQGAETGIHGEILAQMAEQTSCPQSAALISSLAIFLRNGGAAPLQQGHLRANVRRYSGREDYDRRIVGLLDFQDVLPTPGLRRFRSQFDQRVDIEVLFMPWWRLAGRHSELWRWHVEPSSRPLTIDSGTPSSPGSFSPSNSSGSAYLHTEEFESSEHDHEPEQDAWARW